MKRAVSMLLAAVLLTALAAPAGAASPYDFEKIRRQNKANILGKFIGQLEGYGEDSIQYRALCEGVQALMETKRG